jgi:hypothetical protein
MRRVSCGSGSCLPARRTLGYLVSCGSLWVAGLKHKESLAGLYVQQDSHVPNAHAHVSVASDVRAIIGLQDV